MTKWVALLRGINLGPKRRMAMADLRALLENLEYGEVGTLLQSGNAVFTAGGSARGHEKKISAQIKSELGMDVPVLVRSATELAAVFDKNPFLKAKADPKELHAVFLSGKPAAAKVASLDPGKFASDEFEMGNRVIYLRLRHGMQGSRFPDWDRVLAVGTTTRNWNTVTKLRDLTS